MSILKVRDQNGNFVSIPAIKGEDGRTAYEYAKDGGYTGTEAEFAALLNGITGSADAAHYSDLNNPHKVTKAQLGLDKVDNTSDKDKLMSDATAQAIELVQDAIETVASDLGNHTSKSNPHGITAMGIGAIPRAYSTSTDLNLELQTGSEMMLVCSYNSGTKNTPKTEGLTSYAHGMVITNAYSSQYAVQLCMPSGDSNMYIRKKDGTGISAWQKVCNVTDIPTIPTIPKISGIGTYTGNGTYGQGNPCSLTFEAPPKFVFIMKHNASYVGFFIRGVNQYLVASNNGFSQVGNNCTWSGNTLTWLTASNGQEFQLNAGTQTYTYYVGY